MGFSPLLGQGGFGVLAFTVATALVAGAPVARAQVQSVEPYYAVVTQDGTGLWAGPSDRFYTVTRLSTGAVVAVDGESQGFARVLYPSGVDAFVRAEDASVEGTTVRLTRDSRLRAASSVQGWGGSWQVLLDNPLLSGATLTLREPVKEGEVVVAYRVQPPAEARGFIASSRLRRATSDEVASARTGGSIPALPAWTGPTTTTAATTDTTNTTGANAAAAGGVQPANVPATTTATGTTTGSTSGAGQATTDTTLAASADTTAEQLEATFHRVWREPVESSEIDELIAQYQTLIAKVPAEQANRRAALEQRLAALTIRRDYRESLRKQAEEDARLANTTQTVERSLEELASSRVYTVVGTLQPSTVYDGTRLPQMYRIVSVGGTSPRTLGYIRKTSDLDLDRFLGQIVGVIGERSVDRSLQLNLITPVRVDPLRVSNQGVILGGGEGANPAPSTAPIGSPAGGNDSQSQPGNSGAMTPSPTPVGNEPGGRTGGDETGGG